MVNCYAGYTVSEHRGTSPPPFKGGEERSEGGMLSLQRGEERGEALEEQANASAFVPSASGGEPTEQRAGRKKIRLSEAKQVT